MNTKWNQSIINSINFKMDFKRILFVTIKSEKNEKNYYIIFSNTNYCFQ